MHELNFAIIVWTRVELVFTDKINIYYTYKYKYRKNTALCINLKFIQDKKIIIGLLGRTKCSMHNRVWTR